MMSHFRHRTHHIVSQWLVSDPKSQTLVPIWHATCLSPKQKILAFKAGQKPSERTNSK
jgi:hypothetical protein